MRASLLILAACTACSAPISRAPVDASMDRDSALDASDGGVQNTTCKTQRRIVTAAAGSRTESTTYYVDVPGVKPGDDVTVILCDHVAMTTGATCPSGSTCQDIGSYPTGRQCQVIRGSLLHLGDTAVVNCGFVVVSYDANGVETSRAGSYYMNVEIRR